ncbi:MAG: hypothetical protein U5R30_12825 [Deltaproteobacteria bacterium]|nr:hypothetical protein [Deltaproteobacteria bacterium]
MNTLWARSLHATSTGSRSPPPRPPLLSAAAAAIRKRRPNWFRAAKAPVYRPDNAYFDYTEAHLARQSGDEERSVLLLKRASEPDPTSLYLKRELAVVYVQQKDPQNALAAVEDIL